MNKKDERVFSLEFIRVSAMLAVIAIHGSAGFIEFPPMFALNQVCRFAVPVFIILSGIGLRQSSYRQVYTKLPRLLIPYLFWCIIYESFLRPHLYFTVILAQLYFLYPLLLIAVEKYPIRTFTVSLFISLICNSLIFLSYFGLDLYPEPLRPYLWFLFPTWLVYFTGGLLITPRCLQALSAYAARHLRFLIITTAICAVYYVWEAAITGSFYDAIKPSLLIYAPLVIVTFLGLSKIVADIPAFKKLTRYLAGYSETIYYAHVIVLIFIQKCFFMERPPFP
jgi:surface polysaccharide O-acyltransferase-like enzyme